MAKRSKSQATGKVVFELQKTRKGWIVSEKSHGRKREYLVTWKQLKAMERVGI